MADTWIWYAELHQAGQASGFDVLSLTRQGGHLDTVGYVLSIGPGGVLRLTGQGGPRYNQDILNPTATTWGEESRAKT